MTFVIFTAELCKMEMLHEGILHLCIKQLLEKKKKVAVRDMAEDMECLCQIMRTIGRRLDVGKAKVNDMASEHFCNIILWFEGVLKTSIQHFDFWLLIIMVDTVIQFVLHIDPRVGVTNICLI